MTIVIEVADGVPGHTTLVIREQEGFGARCVCGFATFHWPDADAASASAEIHRSGAAVERGVPV